MLDGKTPEEWKLYDSSHSSNHQIERSWNILVSTYFWNISVQFPPPFTEPVYFHFVLQDLSLCAPPPHSSSNAVKLLPLQRCSHLLLCKNLKNSPDSARSPPSPSSVCQTERCSLSVLVLPLRNCGQAGTYFSIHRETPGGTDFNIAR